ncbi:MAG: Excinuclease ABC subunit C [Candidatus Magasanikbacteria bacterium GW2011_GWD2_43_18]|uniref:Excinuclease ABC subunit C n=1 Tax=Candidatus Magasanikbacteria bacterium GW2011_GWE2_42_7 TaxID=1619052 RepID=A0A0G1BE00_9BACT|nr:MAG: Excinuclease ABC subunit C [Candidatus Magasanikbacteria bacterium GW2011_GWC2_42_27]KKS71542.1 MAG: Excinuclease ABC subunit C [Candidatus Magasanikbacteria bacterium GW2011_GWE2_42_7]KKT04108.1 MAG: Excinuclease ABC subunit C [Candidatus Magasanikbacteria bacterium GW2011_GWD2_43_18]KKT24715.1 MAG: Excinuclease ABC subunit C [Candidatus Magasanikbacteria bacterium GW2011_GWA2_43_9]HBB38530.1 hypothetical protein [Candidatus Magasanikbacteria bacterium]
MALHLDLQLKNLPDAPGIYLFFNTKKELIYVGKATSLKSRVSSYFRGQRTMRPIEQMIYEVVDIKWKITDSVLEAIILEANSIKEKQPKYNVLGRDDKSWNYIVITKDEFPIVTTLRQHEYAQKKLEIGKSKLGEYAYVFGPYPGLNTKATMKLLRKLFYLSDCQKRKKQNQQRQQIQQTAKPCLYRQMGLCLGVCTGEISPAEYRQKVIQPLVQFLKGGKKRLITTLKKRMQDASKNQAFEEAARLRNQIASLERIHDIALINKSFVQDEQSAGVKRIEGYDISNLGSSGKVGSMVVFDRDGPVKSQYRKFKIKSVVGQSDVDCLEEVLVRRLRHSNIPITNDPNVRITNNTKQPQKDVWTLPDVFLIDGGKPQVNRAMQVLRTCGIEIPLVGIAKGPERKKNEFIFGTKDRNFIKWVNKHQDLLVRVRDEAHRFAITYQRQTRKLK